MMNVESYLKKLGLIPVVSIDRADQAVDLAEALLAGGLPCAEITLRTGAALEAIRLIKTHRPQLLIGAGTVLSADQAEKAVEAGAGFVVSPGLDPTLLSWSQTQNIPLIPGVATPSEVMSALRAGLDLLKFFPAEALGGVKSLKAISAPFPQVKFMPTGGINPANLSDYLRLPNVVACGGSWLVNPGLIRAGAFSEISALTRQAVAIINQLRSGIGPPAVADQDGPS